MRIDKPTFDLKNDLNKIFESQFDKGNQTDEEIL